MLLQQIWDLFRRKLFHLSSTQAIFNQYRDTSPEFDKPAGARIRRQNLKQYVSSFAEFPTVFLIGEAPGFRGCRFSGVPFTSEQQLVLQSGLMFSGRQSSIAAVPKHEATANVFWRVMRPYFPGFLVWNIVPFHPHNAKDQTKNRTPTAREADAFEGVIKDMVAIVKPAVIVAIGTTAERSLERWRLKHETVRHPSHGGSTKFALAIRKYF